MKYLVTVIFIIIWSNVVSQNYMFKNQHFEYTTFEGEDKQQYVDTVYFYFTHIPKYLKEKENLHSIGFTFGFINDTIDYTISSLLGCNPFKSYNYFEPHWESNIIICKNKYDFIYKICVRDNMMKEINFAFFTSTYNSRYLRENKINNLQNEPVYLGTMDLKRYGKLNEEVRKNWYFIFR